MLNQNQFAQSPVKGQLDLLESPSTISAMVDSSEAGTLVAGQAVVIVDTAGGIPKVKAATADTDDVFGFVNFSIKDQGFVAGQRLEISYFKGNVMLMEAASAIAPYEELMVVISGQKVDNATSGKRIIGFALDKAAASGDLIRVCINLKSGLAA